MSSSHCLLTALAFEQWLRFSWLAEGDCIKVGRNARKNIETHFPELVMLMNRLEGTSVTDGGASRNAILDWAESTLGHETLIHTLDDEGFKTDVRSFQGWVQEEAENTTCDASDFGSWYNAFICSKKK